MKGLKMKNYTCKICGIVKRAWVESDCFKSKLCPVHLDEGIYNEQGEKTGSTCGCEDYPCCRH